MAVDFLYTVILGFIGQLLNFKKVFYTMQNFAHYFENIGSLNHVNLPNFVCTIFFQKAPLFVSPPAYQKNL